MIYRTIPHFIIKKNLQKSKETGIYFSNIITKDILEEICFKITNQKIFTCDYVDNNYKDEFLEKTYNKGRMALLLYEDVVNYISFSEVEINGRNSSVQSVPTAFNIFYLNSYPKKKLFYYFLNKKGNAETEYQILIYRLMITIGFKFLNIPKTLINRIVSFNSIDDLIFNRKINTSKNKSNNSTFITKNDKSEIEIYGKTYGANKYETSLLCYTLSTLCHPTQKIILYEILEGNLKELPASSIKVIKKMNTIEINPIDMKLERKIYNNEINLRSPNYLLNLFKKLGDKQCVLCNCKIPELIQGAHIFPISEIKKIKNITIEKKLEYALDGENGLWLCENHHKLFDRGIISFELDGKVKYKSDLDYHHKEFLEEITKIDALPKKILTNQFLWYLKQRETNF